MLPGEGGCCSAEAASLSFLHLFQSRCPAVLSCPNLPWAVAGAFELAEADGRACCLELAVADALELAVADGRAWWLELAVADALELAGARPPIGVVEGLAASFAEGLAVVHWQNTGGCCVGSVAIGRSALAI